MARFLPFSPEASLLLASGEPPSFVFAAIRGGFSSLSLGTLSGCESIDSHPLLLRCQNTHVAQLRSVFVALHQEKIIKNRLEALKSDRLLRRQGSALLSLLTFSCSNHKFFLHVQSIFSCHVTAITSTVLPCSEPGRRFQRHIPGFLKDE